MIIHQVKKIIILKILELSILKEIQKILKHLLKYQKQIHSLFHFGEFARIYQSFKY